MTNADANVPYRGRYQIIEVERPFERVPLRRPFPDATSQAEPLQSTLSADAAEFVPRSAVAAPVTIAAPQQLSPRVYSSECNTAMEEPNVLLDSQDPNYLCYELVNQVVMDLTINPGHFDEAIFFVEDTLSTLCKDRSLLEKIVDLIFDYSVGEPNFHYTSARMCNHLCKNLKFLGDERFFRSLLLARCQKDFVQYKDNDNPEDQPYLRGFTIFLGELFCCLELGSGKLQRIQALGEALYLLVEKHLRTADPENLKCACKLLKLAGQHLDEMDRGQRDAGSEANSRMLSIQQQVKNRLGDASIPPEVKLRLQSVVELIGDDWGRSGSVQHPDGSNTRYQHMVPPYQDIVLYGPDNQPLTEEEAAFLESNEYLTDAAADDDTQTGLYGMMDGLTAWSAEDMDAGVDAAYESFLSELPQ